MPARGMASDVLAASRAATLSMVSGPESAQRSSTACSDGAIVAHLVAGAGKRVPAFFFASAAINPSMPELLIVSLNSSR